MQAVVTLTGYKFFEGTNAKGPWKKNVFTSSEGKEFYTFQAPLATQAHAFVTSGQPVAVEYEEELRDGKYTNYKLTAVSVAPDSYGVPQPTTISSAQYPLSPATLTQESKEERIARAVALKAAIEIFTAIGQDPILYRSEMLEYADTLTPWLLTGVDAKAPESVEA